MLGLLAGVVATTYLGPRLFARAGEPPPKKSPDEPPIKLLLPALPLRWAGPEPRKTRLSTLSGRTKVATV